MNKCATDVDNGKFRLILKQWELEFIEETGRKPAKEDIVNAPNKIRDAYKSYWRTRVVVQNQDVASSSAVSKTPKTINDVESFLPMNGRSIWDSSLNKSTNSLILAKSKKTPSNVLAKYTEKLQANATLIRNKCVGSLTMKQKEESITQAEDHHDAVVPSSFASAYHPFNDNTNEKRSSRQFFGSVKVKMTVAESRLAKSSKSISVAPGTFLNKKDSQKYDSFDCDVFKELNCDLDGVVTNKTSPLQLEILPEPDREGMDEIVTETFVNSGQLDHMSVNFKQGRKIDTTLNISEVEHTSKMSSEQTRRQRRKRDKTELELETLPLKKPRGDSFSDISSSKMNNQRENYVRINLKKKVFCRGKKKFNYRRYKFSKWKQMNKWKDTPYPKCQSPDGEEEGKDDEDYSSIPVEIILDAKARSTSAPRSTNDDQESCQEMISTVAASNDTIPAITVVSPLCELVNGKLPNDVEDDVTSAMKRFGYSQFQFGQLETIKRVLAGLPTLLIQPTGSGKSLCYLLPAFLYARRLGAVTLVISPLVSLMDDQLVGVPKCLRAACHHSGMTTKQRDNVRDSFSSGKVDILFLSPEALVSGAGSVFGVLPIDMPPIAFVCIDEIHCVSAWSHNFRPCYLRLCRVIRDVLGVRCILGLTATASNATAENIVECLGVSREDLLAVIRFNLLPDNLVLTVSRNNREEAFLELLKSEPFMHAPSIIVYCIRREQTERLASIIRTCLQTEADEWTADAYHAGLSPSLRHSVQQRFMSGKLRVVVATVAFGMGLNKSDVRAVIHFNMPKSIDSYVQEIGRAGRDGQTAHCHLFLDLHGGDKQELGRHIYANTVDRAAIKKLLIKIFLPCRCNSLKEIEGTLLKDSQCSADGHASESPHESWKCSGHEVAFNVDEAVEELDIKEEGIDTLLCYLESHPEHPIKLLNRTYANCVIFSYGGTKQLANLAEKNYAVAVAMALAKKKHKLHSKTNIPSNQIEFNLTELARMLGLKSADLRCDLKKLQWNTTEEQGVVKYRKTDFVVDFVGISFHVMAVGDLSSEKLDQITSYLHNRVLLKENTDIKQLESFHSILHNVSAAHYLPDDKLNHARSQKLKADVRGHFEKSSVPSVDEVMSLTYDNNSLKDVVNEDDIRANIIQFLGIHHDIRFSGRAVARIFHGIDSPRYPAKVWGKARQFWRCHLHINFNTLCRLAMEEILR